MNRKSKLISYLVLLGIAALIVGLTVSFEAPNLGGGNGALMRCLSDGFFTTAALFLGCGVLMMIQDAGNFYGVSYLFYTMVKLFSFGKGHYEEKKNYYTYCLEKRERRKAEGVSPLRPALLILGACALLLSFAFVGLFYKQS